MGWRVDPIHEDSSKPYHVRTVHSEMKIMKRFVGNFFLVSLEFSYGCVRLNQSFLKCFLLFLSKWNGTMEITGNFW